MVQIRDYETHRPLPGFEIGDIGPKYGFDEKDNGYMIMKNIRIPRTDLFRRYINVSKEGEVTRKGNPLVLYSTMMFTRIQVTHSAIQNMAKATTIGTRYAIVRSQFINKEGADGKLIERPLIEYQTH